jgi:spermidine synthase
LYCFIYVAGKSPWQWIAVIALGLIVCARQSKLYLFLSMTILFGLIFIPVFKEKHILLQERNFYGVKQVVEYRDAHALVSQSTVHGIQFIDKPMTGKESYYAPPKDIIGLMGDQVKAMSATLIGLGAGTMLCQFRKTDHVTVIEIDQQVIDIAKNPDLFTYLRDCPPHVEIFKNDGRLELKNMADASQQVLILDAFNSDAIPTHLLTIEALKLYKKKITRDGCIMVHLSNRHLELLPVLNAAGNLLNLQVYSLTDKGNLEAGQFPSKWALLTANQTLLAQLKSTEWHFSDNRAPQFLWTDDYSNIVPLLKWM